MVVVDECFVLFWDKVELCFVGFDEVKFCCVGVCVVFGVIVCCGMYFGKDVVLMLSFINIGVYVGEGIMVDIWVTVGLC
ncbi:2,3,4,5-tetrahydropyridine-2,6-dicarboxylate N-succinyltransferase, partial [Xanthomonas citri pv. citri]|nr:2,3,4,5-tetrahydropyridine-2,6-dicarboxylate N-succinyltransferase [Xanthomonas citri pv. citri]